MLWIILLMVIHVRGEASLQQDEDRSPSKRILYNDLSITYDHCRAPQRLNREKWTCECPGSLKKRGDDCVCEDCLFSAKDESYAEKSGKDLPEYVAGFIKDLDSEPSGGIAARMLHGVRDPVTEDRREKKRKIREYARKILNVAGSICDVGGSGGRRSSSMILVAKSDSSFLRFLKGLRKAKYSRPELMRLKKLDWNKARILNLKKVPIYPFVIRPEVLKLQHEDDGMILSETSVGNVMRGKVQSGDDKAYGVVSNLYGTGSMSMGAGQGSALASAYTGEGLSVSGLESRGGKAYGTGLIGKKAYRGTSTTALLIGEGDAIATNSQSKKSSASATAVATKKVATAGSTAYGAASAAASATPGKGAADGSASFGDTLQAIAKVGVKSPRPVAESASVGSEEDDLQDFVNRQRESRVSDGIDRWNIFAGFHHSPPSPDFNLFGLSDESTDSDWFN